LCASVTVRLELPAATCTRARRTSCAVSSRSSTPPMTAVTSLRTPHHPGRLAAQALGGPAVRGPMDRVGTLGLDAGIGNRNR